jgi:formylglycine-generating enzyme required for sulfatase activity
MRVSETLVAAVIAVIAAAGCRKSVHHDPPRAAMVLIPAGDFHRGCAAATPSCNAEERPQHEVELSAYYIDRTEVTQSAYRECVRAGKCVAPSRGFTPEQTPEFPVVDVSWQQAADYCAFAGKRLPTEAEWEKAARADTGRVYPWGNVEPTCELAAYTVCGKPPGPVGTHPLGKSPYGVLDLAGGVEEWTGDWYGADYYQRSARVDPRGPQSGVERVARGGAYDPWHIRSTARDFLVPTYTDGTLGFRCARSAAGG